MARPEIPQMPQPERVEDVRKIHEAMEATGGDLTAAAKLLGKERGYLQKQIHRCPELKLRWTTSKTATEQPTTNEAEQSRDLVKTDEDEFAAVCAREEESFRRGLEKMGVIGSAQQIAVAFQQFGRVNYTGMLRMIAGGLANQFVALQQEIDKITRELDEGGREMPFIDPTTLQAGRKFVPLTPGREKILRDDRSRLLEQMQRMSDRGHKAALTQAVIKNKLEGRTRKAKPSGYLDLNSAKVVNLPLKEGEGAQG